MADDIIPEGAENVIPVEGQADVGQPGGEGQVADPNFDGANFTFQYKNQPVVPKDRAHLLALAQKGHGFNTHWDAFQKEKEQFEGTRSQYDKYHQLDQLFQQNPELQTKINNVVYEHQNPQAGAGAAAGEEVDPSVSENRQILGEIKGIQDSITSGMADKKLDGEMEKLKSTYKDHDWYADDGSGTLERKVLMHAKEGNFPTMESAYQNMMWPTMQASAAANALKGNKIARQDNIKAGVVGTGSAPAPAKGPIDVTGKSYNQLAQGAIDGTL